MARNNLTTTLEQALSDLESERERIDEAATALRSMLAQAGAGARVGQARPGGHRRKPHWTAAMKAAAKARMQKYWAARRKKQRPPKKAQRSPARTGAKTPGV